MKCDKCQQDKDDALRRMSPQGFKTGSWHGLDTDPVLCAECCADYPGHAWMKDRVGATTTA
jgi:hypothetical protein